MTMSAALNSTLDSCERMLAEHLAAVTLRFGAAGVGLVDLPPLGSEPIVAAQVRVAAALYGCRELEQAGLPSLVEALAERLARGELNLALGAGAQRLARIWRQRAHRFAALERQGLYARLFGPPGAPGAFDALLGSFMRTAAEIGRRPRDRGIGDLQARLGWEGGTLARELSDKATGIAAFAAREILGQVREAREVLADPDVRLALGGGTPWTTVARWAPRLLGREVSPPAHLERAAAGVAALYWIATAAPDVPAAARAVQRGHQLVDLAERWLAVTATGAVAVASPLPPPSPSPLQPGTAAP
jgi:hypothetical protein